jgi:hypothetical protein
MDSVEAAPICDRAATWPLKNFACGRRSHAAIFINPVKEEVMAGATGQNTLVTRHLDSFKNSRIAKIIVPFEV